MKVVIVNNRYFLSSGPERYMFRITEELEARGHTVVPFSIKSQKNRPTPYESSFADPPGGQDTPYFRGMNFSLKTAFGVVTRLFYSSHVRKKLSTVLAQEKPDVVYLLHHYNKLSPSVIDACKEHGIRVVMRLSDYFLVCPQAHLLCKGTVCDRCITTGNYFHATANKCIMNSRVGSLLKSAALTYQHKILKIYSKVDTIICTNEFMQETLKRANLLQDKNIVCLPTPMPEWQPAATEPASHPYFMYLGRVTVEKGVDLLLKAYCQSKVYENGLRLHIAGSKKEDMEEEFLKLLTAEERTIIDAHVDFCGFLGPKEVNEELSKALFTVHPSRWVENLPNTILEAFSHHKPVITANVGSLPYVVKDGVNGLLYEYNNIESLKECIVKLGCNEYLREQLTNSTETASHSYNAKKHIDTLLQLLEIP